MLLMALCLRQPLIPVKLQIAVMKHHIVETAEIAFRINMHLSNALGMIPASCKFRRQGTWIIPGYPILISHALVGPLAGAGH